MVGRVKRDKATNASFEAISIEVGGIESSIATLQKQMGTITGGIGITDPEPNIPFIIAQRNDVDGIFLTTATKIPSTTTTLRIIIIRKSDNQKKSSDASDAAAVERGKQKSLHYRFQVSEDEAAAGSVEREIGPFKPRKSATDQSYQLIRLVALDDMGAFGFNPEDNPFSGTGPFNTGDQLFTALIVRDKYDKFDAGHAAGDPISTDSDKRFFNVGNSVDDIPSKPDLTLITCNRADLTTIGHKAEVEVKVFASDADHTKTFQDEAVDHCFAKFTRVGDPAQTSTTGGDANDHHFGGPVTDLTATFVLIKCSLFLGVQYSWTRNITTNASDRRVSTPAAPVLFFAGGGNLLSSLQVIPGLSPGTNIPGQSNDAKLKLVAAVQNVHHTKLTATWQQPGAAATACDPTSQPVLIKRVEILEKLPTDAGFNLVRSRTILHKKKDFAAGAINEIFKVKHKARITGILYQARLIGVGDETTNTLTTFQTSINSTFDANAPPDPVVADLVDNSPDGDTSRHDTKTGFKVYTTLGAQKFGNGVAGGDPAAPTFRQQQADHVKIRIKRLHNDDAGEAAATDDLTSRHKHYGGPIPDEDLDSTSTIVEVLELRLGKRYRWDRNILISHGVPAKSPGVANPVDFYAGTGIITGSFDPSRLLNLALTITRINKRHSKIVVKYDQPAPTGTPPAPAVYIKSVEIFQKLPSESAFLEIHHRPLRNKPPYSSNTSVGDLPSPNTAIHKEVPFKVHHPPNLSGIQYYAIIRAEGNAIVYVPGGSMITPSPVTDTSTGNDAPSQAPSTPSLGDIIQNTIQGDVTMGHAKVTFRVYATWQKSATGQGGSGPNGELCFVDVSADRAEAVIVDANDPTTSQRYVFGAAIEDPDPVTGKPRFFIDIETPVLTAGKLYMWRRNTTSNGGAVTKSPTMDLPFYAGGSSGLPGLPELTSLSLVLNTVPIAGSLTKVDSRHAEAVLSFTQAASRAGTGTITSSGASVTGSGTQFFSQLELSSKITANGQTRTVIGIFSQTSLMIDSAFSPAVTNASFTLVSPLLLLKRAKLERALNNSGNFVEYKGRRLLDQPEYQQAGIPSVVRWLVQHPKKTAVAVRATIIAVGDNSVIVPQTGSYTSVDEPAFEDAGGPSAPSATSARWINSHIRARFDLPVGAGNNMNTHATNKILLYFQLNSTLQFYLWNPYTRTTLLTASPIDPILNNYGTYMLDIGKTSTASFNVKIPHSNAQAEIELDTDPNHTVFQAINNFGGVLDFAFVVYNEFNNVLTPSTAIFQGIGIPAGWNEATGSPSFG